MKKYLVGLFLLISSLASFGQDIQHRWLGNNSLEDVEGTADLIAKDYADYSPDYKVEGTYGFSFNNANGNRYITNAPIDLSTGGHTITFWVKLYNEGINGTLVTNRAAYNSQGSTIQIDGTAMAIKVIGEDGSGNEGFATSTAASIAIGGSGYWVTVRWMDIDGDYATIWINGVLATTDSLIYSFPGTGSGRNDTLSFGAHRDRFNTCYEYMDYITHYNFAASATQIDELYDNRTSGTFTLAAGAGCTTLLGGTVGSNQTNAGAYDLAAFTSSVAASGGSGSGYTYTWQYSTTSSTAGSSGWTDIGSSNATTHDYGSISVSTNFTRKVVNAACSATAYSNVIQCTVTGAGTYNPTAGRHGRPKDNGVYIIPMNNGEPVYWVAVADIVIPGYSSRYRDIAHAQVAVIPANAVNGDRVVELNYNRNWEIQTSLVYTYLSGPQEFVISGSNLNVSAVPASGTYKYYYTISDGTIVDTASVKITVVPSGSCVFINPSFAGTSSGSRTNPWKNLTSFAWTNNTYYFINRGTTYNITSGITPSANNISIGAYGTGNRPIIANTGATGCIGLNSRTNVVIRDIKMTDAGSSNYILTVSGISANIVYDNLVLDGLLAGTFNLLRWSDGTITGGSISNSEFMESYEDPVFIHADVTGANIDNKFLCVGNYIHDVNPLGATGADGWDMGVGDHRWWYIAYNLFDRSSSGNKHDLLYGSTHVTSTEDVGTTIEHNRMEGYQTFTPGVNQNCLSLFTARGAIVRYNVCNWGTYGLWTTWWDGWSDNSVGDNVQWFPWMETGWDDRNDNVQVYGNIFTNIFRSGVYLNHHCDNWSIYNNTFYDFALNTAGEDGATERAGIMNYSATGISVRNNIFYTTSANYITPIRNSGGTINEDYNMFYPNNGTWTMGPYSLEDDPEFTNRGYSDYEINQNSPAYHKGVNMSLTYDIFGDTYGTPPSMGYREYTSISNPVYASKYELSHNMETVIPDDAIANDYVVELNYNRAWRTKSVITYTMKSGDATIFKVESGILKINNPATMSAGTYNIVVTVADGIFNSDMTVEVTVVSAANCRYYHASGGTNAGTRANPYIGIPTAISQTGKYYFFKRGDTFTGTSTPSDISADDIVVGAYGTGNRPKWNNSAYNGNYGYLQLSGDRNNITIRDIEFRYGNGNFMIFTGYNVLGTYDHTYINIDNCVFHESAYAEAIDLWGVQGGRVSNCVFYDFDYDAIHVNDLGGFSETDRFVVEGNWFYDLGLYNLVDGGAAPTGDCWQYDETGRAEHTIFRHNFFDRSSVGYKHGLLITAGKAYATTDMDIIVEYNYFLGHPTTMNQNNLTIHSGNGVIVRYNILKSAHRSIFNTADWPRVPGDEGWNTAGEDGVWSNNMQIYGNVIDGSRYKAIELQPSADGTKIYNNTIVNFSGTYAIDLTNSGFTTYAANVEVKNNIFYSTAVGSTQFLLGGGSSTFVEAYNLYYPNYANRASTSKYGNPLFFSGNSNAYEIGTSSPAYHAGVAIFGITTDIFTDTYNNPPSMGAKEYIP